MMKESLPVLRVLLLAVTATSATLALAQAPEEEYPPNAKPGECWAKCVIAPKFETYTEQVLVKEKGSRVEVIPATYETVSEQVMVKPASTRLEIIPATFETVTERVVSKEASSRLERVPAVYEDVTETIEVSPATTRWEKGKATASCLSANPEDCRVWCLVEVPAQYRTISKRVLKSPETTREIAVPAEYGTITKRVLKTPESTREVTIPAEYKTVTRTVLKNPPSTRELAIPAEYKTVSHRRVVSEGSVTDWRRVVCDADLTSGRIRGIQLALKAKGYDPGPIDNRFGALTRAALIRYQQENNLPQGSLDFETLASLGVK